MWLVSMSNRERQIALVYKLIEKIWGNGVLMQFEDIVNGEEK